MMQWSFRGKSLALRFLMGKKSCRRTLECVSVLFLACRGWGLGGIETVDVLVARLERDTQSVSWL